MRPWRITTSVAYLATSIFPGIIGESLPASDNGLPKVYTSSMIADQGGVYENDENVRTCGKEPTYAISIENRCGIANSPTNMHFMVVNESKRMAYNNGSNLTASITDHFATAMEAGTSQVFEFEFGRSASHLESTWRLWWDTDQVGYSRNQTLVEVHCSVYETASCTQTCNMDVSNVDGLTSAVKVTFPGTEFTSITLEPPADWRCPESNRISAAGRGGVPENFLPESQACLSNCSLLGTNDACCPHPYTADNCTNANPALVIAGPEAYTFAYDDHTIRCRDNICLQPLRAHEFRQNSRIMHIVTCFASS